MSNLAHRFALRDGGCVCGSEWNWIADECSSIIAIPARKVDTFREGDDYPDLGFFECRRGHVFCGRH